MKRISIAAGGTGGHINAALSLGAAFEEMYEVEYITGQRHLDYKLFEGKQATHYSGKALRVKDPLILIKNSVINLSVFFKIASRFLRNRPQFVIGTGGYICGPCLLVAWTLGIPIFVVEQNAVSGVTNKILARFAKTIFTNFSNTKGLSQFKSKTCIAGNPIRSNITYNKNNVNKEAIKVLIFGGSLGAKDFNKIVPRLLEKENIHIKHQLGKNNKYVVKDKNYESFEYIDDMNEAYAWANIIIARSGASTVSELEIIKKPAILIPYRFAVDNHQYYNALELKNKKFARVEVTSSNSKKIVDETIEKIESIIAENDFAAYSQVVPPVATKIIKERVLSQL